MKNLLIYTLLSMWILGADSWSVVKAGEIWKIGHVRSTNSAVHKDLTQFTETVQSRSGDTIRFSIYPGNKLGDYSVVQERVSFGEVEMFLGPIGTTLDKRVSLAWIPYLVDNWTHAEKVYAIGSPLWRQIDQYLNSHNVKLVGGWPVYFGGIGLTKKVQSPADPEVNKKTIIRVPPIRSFEITARELGFTPYPITWQYARMGLKTGMVGGLIGGGAEGYAGLSDNIRYYLPVKDHFEYWFLYINLDLWKSLTDSERELLAEAAQIMERERYRIAAEAEAESMLELKKRGVTILDISGEQLQRMQEKVRKEAWPAIQEDIGEDFTTLIESVMK